MALFSSLQQTDSLCCCPMQFWMSDCSFFFTAHSEYLASSVLAVLIGSYMADAKWSAAILVYTLCTPYKHAPVYSVTFFEATCKVCLSVTCHLHIWQNDRDLLRATAVTLGWNVYQNKSQHRNTGEENSPTAPVGTWSLNISITSPALYHWTNPAYHAIHFYPVSSNHFNTYHSEKDTSSPFK